MHDTVILFRQCLEPKKEMASSHNVSELEHRGFKRWCHLTETKYETLPAAVCIREQAAAHREANLDILLLRRLVTVSCLAISMACQSVYPDILARASGTHVSQDILPASLISALQQHDPIAVAHSPITANDWDWVWDAFVCLKSVIAMQSSYCTAGHERHTTRGPENTRTAKRETARDVWILIHNSG